MVFEGCAKMVLPGYWALVTDDLSSELDVVHVLWLILVPDADLLIVQQIISNDDVVRAVYGANLGAQHTDFAASATLESEASLFHL